MDIKRLCLANGDEYEEVVTELDRDELIEVINRGEIVIVESEGKEIVLNSEFIISFEVGESRKLTVI